MVQWKHRIHIKHLFTEDEDYESVLTSMLAIQEEIRKHRFMDDFRLTYKFSTIPQNDEVISPLCYANVLLNRLYDYCDDNLIWVE